MKPAGLLSSLEIARPLILSPYSENVDLFFIDGAHAYEYVRNDTLKALECVATRVA